MDFQQLFKNFSKYCLFLLLITASFSSYSQKKKENRSFVQKLLGDTPGSAITFLPYATHTRKADFYGVSYFAVNYKSWEVNTFRNSWGDQNYSLSYKRTLNFNERFLLSYGVGIMYGYDGRLGGNDNVPLSNTFLFNGKINPVLGLEFDYKVYKNIALHVTYAPLILLYGVRYYL